MAKAQISSRKLRAAAVAMLAVVAAFAPQPAIAGSTAPAVGAVLQSAGAVITAASRCVTFVYDKNGNRLVQTTAVPPSGPQLWGTAVYGCFAWQPPAQ